MAVFHPEMHPVLSLLLYGSKYNELSAILWELIKMRVVRIYLDITEPYTSSFLRKKIAPHLQCISYLSLMIHRRHKLVKRQRPATIWMFLAASIHSALKGPTWS